MADFYGRYAGILGGGGGGGGGGGSGAPYQETPVGLVNGANTIFTLSQAPTVAAGLMVYLDGLEQAQGVDYTISGTTITFTSAPLPAQSVYAYYVVASGVTGVTDINTTATGSVSIVAGAGISVSTVGSTITVTNTGGTGGGLTVVASRASPDLITAGGGIAFGSTTDFTKNYIAGSAGAVTVTANPQIAPGTSDGQELTLQSRSATNTVTLNDGTGLVMNGPWVGGLDSLITFTWDTANWVEKGRQ